MKSIKSVFILTALILLSSTIIDAQTDVSDEQALSIIKDAVQVLGGESQLKSYVSIFVSAKGVEHRSAEIQGYEPDKQTTASHEEKLAVFMDGVRLAFEYNTGRHDGTTRYRRTIYIPDQRISADFITQTATASPVKFPLVERTELARILPHTILLEVLANQSLVKYVGIRIYDNREHDVVAYRPPTAKVSIILYFDKNTHLLSKYEYLADFPTLGEVITEYTFSDYRQHNKLKWFPYSREIKVAGKVYRSMQYQKVLVDSEEATAMLQLPANLEGYIAPPETVSEIAKGVYIVYKLGGYQPLFIEFKDFVLAVEAPVSHPSLDDVSVESFDNSEGLSERFISIIKRTIKNKPIRYLVPTHFHDDHAGGARAFMAESSTILTTPGNKTFFEKMALTKFAVGNQIASLSALKLEIFGKKKIITDGEKTVELINVGPNPHTAENIIVYLPKENIIYQGDLFYFYNESSFPPKDRLTVMPFFANWLIQNKLAPSRIYGLHSLSFATMKHVNEILGEKFKTKNK